MDFEYLIETISISISVQLCMCLPLRTISVIYKIFFYLGVGNDLIETDLMKRTSNIYIARRLEKRHQ